MKREFELEGLECANCARKAQEAVEKIEGTSNVQVSFLMTKLSYDVEDGKDKEVEEEVKKVINKILPDVAVLPWE